MDNKEFREELNSVTKEDLIVMLENNIVDINYRKHLISEIAKTKLKRLKNEHTNLKMKIKTIAEMEINNPPKKVFDLLQDKHKWLTVKLNKIEKEIQTLNVKRGKQYGYNN